MKHNWEYKRLGEVCAPKSRIARASKLFSKEDIIEYYDISCVDNVNHSIKEANVLLYRNAPSRAQQKVERYDVLYSLVRPNLKNIAIIEDLKPNMVASTGFAVLRGNLVLPNFLFWLLLSNTFTRHILSKATGASYPAVTERDVRDVIIPVPPKAEQSRIVLELDKINELIATRKEQLRELDNLAQSLFYDTFGDPITNPKGWEVKKWEQVVTIINGKNQKSVEDLKGIYPIYGSGGIMGHANDYICPEFCTIIGRKGSINKPLFVKTKFWNVDTAFGIMANISFITPIFLFYFCKGYNFMRYNKATTLPSLVKSDLLKINMPVPPLLPQHQFARQVEAIEAQKQVLNESLKELQTLLDSRMDYWFN